MQNLALECHLTNCDKYWTLSKCKEIGSVERSLLYFRIEHDEKWINTQNPQIKFIVYLILYMYLILCHLHVLHRIYAYLYIYTKHFVSLFAFNSSAKHDVSSSMYMHIDAIQISTIYSILVWVWDCSLTLFCSSFCHQFLFSKYTLFTHRYPIVWGQSATTNNFTSSSIILVMHIMINSNNTMTNGHMVIYSVCIM